MKRRVDYNKSVVLRYNTHILMLVGSIFSPARKNMEMRKKKEIVFRN